MPVSSWASVSSEFFEMVYVLSLGKLSLICKTIVLSYTNKKNWGKIIIELLQNFVLLFFNRRPLEYMCLNCNQDLIYNSTQNHSDTIITQP